MKRAVDLSGEILHGLRRYELKRASSSPIVGVDRNPRSTSFFDRCFHLRFLIYLPFLDARPMGPHFFPGRVAFPDIKYSRGAGASDIQSCELVGWLSPRGVSTGLAAKCVAYTEPHIGAK